MYKRYRVLMITLLLFAVIGAGLILMGRAATSPVTLETEAGIAANGATVYVDAGSSNGRAVRFGAAEASCPAALHTPGGSDGKGGCWPGAHNTGYPHAVAGDTRPAITLTTYTGPCTITASNTVIDSKIVSGCDDLTISGSASNVIIKNSLVQTDVRNDGTDGLTPGSVTVIDSTIDASNTTYPAVWNTNVTLTRVEVRGAQHSILCYHDCVVTDSWLHAQALIGSTHNNSFLTNGGHDMTITHNSLNCDAANNASGGGCSSDLSIIGDFETNYNITADSNLFVANSGPTYCAYGGASQSKPYQAHHIVYQNNIFQRGASGKCASGGPITGFDLGAPGNTWVNNVWDSGGVVPSAN